MIADELVQVILVDSTGTHAETVTAAAQASLTAFRMASDSWEPWLAASFTKTVRRVKPAQFDLAASRFDARDITVRRHGPPTGMGRALAFAPMLAADFPREVVRAQVAGTDMDRTGLTRATEATLQFLLDGAECLVVVNDDLGMSTGKECAQAAHGAWLGALALGVTPYKVNPVIRRVDQATFDALCARPDGVVCMDAGRTELAGPTRTVVTFTNGKR